MNVVIIEDELPAAEQIRRYLNSYKQPINIIGIYSSCEEIIRNLNAKSEIDVVFCDIELRDGNAFIALQKIDLKAVIIFTTAYDHFWKDSLQYNGIDYLLKPITSEKVHSALNKVINIKRILTKDNILLQQLSNLIQRNENASYKKRFPAKFAGELYIIDVKDVILFRIMNGIIYAISSEKKKYPIMEETLSALEDQLDPKEFLRVNRSDIININYIQSIRIKEGSDYSISLNNIEEKIVVSQSRINQLKEWFA